MGKAADVKTLVVNDDHSFRNEVTNALVFYGGLLSENVNVATDGELALKFLKEAPSTPHYDLIITGGNLKGKFKGPALVRAIRGLESYEEIPIIIASQHPRFVKEGVLAGATAYMERPLDHFEEFLRRIFELLHLPYKGSRVFFHFRTGRIIEVIEGEEVIATIGSHKKGLQVVVQKPDIAIEESTFDDKRAVVFVLPD